MVSTLQSAWGLMSSLTLLGSALLTDGSPRRITPSRSELELTLTSSRFDDSCMGTRPGDACPPINIYRVFVQKPICARWHGPMRNGEPAARLVRCRYLAAVGTSSSKRSQLPWFREAAILRWESYRDFCLQGERKRGGFCGSNWVVETLASE